MRFQNHPRIRRGFLFLCILAASFGPAGTGPFSPVFASGFPSSGFQVSLFEGTSTSPAEPMRTFEGQQFPVLWQAVGYLRFSGNGEPGISKSSQGPPDQSDLGAIRVSLRARWKDPSGNSHEKTLSSSDFADSALVRSFSPMGGESYSFVLETAALSGGSDGLFPLQCDDPALSWFDVFLEAGFPWTGQGAGQGAGQGDPGNREWGHRPVLVIDARAPSVSFTSPSADSFPVTGTSGDPPPFASVVVEIRDSNPNQEMASATLSIGGEEQIDMTQGTPRRDHTPSPGDPAGRYAVDFSWSPGAPPSPQLLLPPGTDEVELTVTGQPRFPVIGPESGTATGIVEIMDNDAPSIECILTWPGPSGQETLAIRVQGGETDIPFDGNGTLDITLGTAGIQFPDPYSRGLGTPASVPVPVDLGTVFAETDWPAIPEDTRITARIRCWDNFDPVPGPGPNIVELSVNGSAVSDGPLPLIFREAGNLASAIEVLARDRAGNSRLVRVPVKVLDTRMRVDTIK